jgi:drug/metabolite transporter, DME family
MRPTGSRAYHARMRDRGLLLGSLTVVAAASGFGILGPLARFAYEAGLGPLSFVAWRAAFGALVLAAYAAWRIGRGRALVLPWRLPSRQFAALVLAGLMSLSLNVSMFFAFDRVSVALALLAFYTYPALVAVIAVGRGYERLDASRVIALVMSLAGMVLVVVGGLDPAGGVRIDPLGIGLALVAALSQTIFVTVSRAGYPSMPAEQAIGWMLAGTVVVCSVLALAAGDASGLGRPLVSPGALSLASLGGVLAAGIPSLLFLTGIRTIGGTRTGILMLFEPVVGVILAAALLDERLVPIQALGGLAILVAALLLQRSARGVPTDGQVASTAPIAAASERS